jgi:phage terminase small subunit
MARKDDSGLTAKQLRFVSEYLIDLTAKQAAIRAGYSAKTAEVQGCRLLSHAKVAAAITEGQAKLAQESGITVKRIVDELAKIGSSNMLDYMTVGADGLPYVDLSKLTRDQAAAIAEVTVDDFTEGRGENKRDVRRVRFKLADKRAALVDLGKHLGMFVDRHQHSGAVTLVDLIRQSYQREPADMTPAATSAATNASERSIEDRREELPTAGDVADAVAAALTRKGSA